MKEKNRSLLSLTLIYTIGNLSSKLIGFVLVFFTTYYLTREQVGQFDLILISVNLLIPLVSLQLSDSGLRWLLGAENNDSVIKKTITSICFFYFLSIVLFSVCYQGYNIFNPSPYSVYLNTQLALQVVYILFQQTIRGMGFNRLYASNSIINAFLYFGLSILLLTTTSLKVEALLIANIFALLITSIQLFIRAKMYRYISFNYFSWNHLKELLRYSIPLMPNSLSWWAMSSANRYFILLYIGAFANGIFAISYKIPTIMTMLVGIFSLAWQERSILTYESDERDRYYSGVFKKYLLLIFSVSFLIVSVNQVFIRVAVSEEFFEAYRYTPILILSTIFNSIASFYGTGFLGAKKTKGLLISSLIGGLSTVLVSLILIPYFGLFGASFSILLGYIVLLCLRIYQSKNVFNIDFPYGMFSIYVLLFILISAIGYIENNYMIAFNIILAICVVGFLNRDLIKTILASDLKNIEFNKILKNKE
ncbi:polysaccharide biosynthesis C-terminal domain-containing protein [Sphingobacterium sp.]|uniref:lipopolysaccharide biosynthesis protein n=1 Tax=Sphingobacterium sp. TaxID=341027 RepID=UPI0031D4E758